MSITKAYNEARKTKPDLKFGDFQSTYSAPKSSVAPSAPKAEQTPFQQMKSGGITSQQYQQTVKEQSHQRSEAEFNRVQPEGTVYDPYAALQARQMGGTKEAVSPYVKEGIATAIRDRTYEGVGSQPQESKPPEGGWASEEDKLRAQVSDQQALSDWYKRVSEDAMKEIGTTTMQMEQLGDKMGAYESSIKDLIQQIGQSNPELSSALDSAIVEAQELGGGAMSPEILAQIQKLAESNPSVAEFKSTVSSMLSSSVSPEGLSSAGIIDTGTGFTLSNGISFPKGSNGLPDFKPENLSPATNAYDIALMQYMLGNQTADTMAGQEIERLKNLSDSVTRAQATAKEEIKHISNVSQNRVDEEKLASQNELAYQKMRLEIEKDRSLGNIREQEAQMEGYMKGQLEAWGADQSSAALSVMGSVKDKFLKQYTDTAMDYDMELARLSEKEVEVRMAYTNRSIEIANQYAIGLEKINNNILDSINEISLGTKSVYENRDLKKLQNGVDYLSTIQGLKDAEEQARQGMIKDTRDFSFDLMKQYADQSGYLHQVTQQPDGTYGVEMVKDPVTGLPIPTLARERESRLSSGDSGTTVTGGSTAGAPQYPGYENSSAFTAKEIETYISGIDPNWVKNTGTGQITGYGSPAWKWGLDIDGKIGDPLTTPVSGTVLRTTTTFPSNPGINQKGFGNQVVLLGDDGKIYQFSHMDKVIVEKGRINAGEQIGTIGNTGYVIPGKGGDGSHLDLTVYNSGFSPLSGYSKSLDRVLVGSGMNEFLTAAGNTYSALTGKGNILPKAETPFPSITLPKDLNTYAAEKYVSLLKEGKTWADGGFGDTVGERNVKNYVDNELSKAGWSPKTTSNKLYPFEGVDYATLNKMTQVQLTPKNTAYDYVKHFSTAGASQSEIDNFLRELKVATGDNKKLQKEIMEALESVYGTSGN